MLTSAKIQITALIGFMCLPASVRSEIRYVDAQAGGGDGSTWAQAFDDLQDALSVAQTGDEVWLARGTYTPSDCGGGPCTPQHRAVPFLIDSGITLLGGFSGSETAADERDPALHPTILSGDLNDNDDPNFVNYDDNSYHVVYVVSSVVSAVVDGLIIRGGNADGLEGLGSGGGIQVETFAKVTVNGCTIRDNSAVLGGGVFTAFSSLTTLNACLLKHNRAQSGGGMYNNSSIPRLINSRLVGNEALLGGGVFNINALTTVSNCTFTENFALDQGGALFITNPDGVVIHNSILFDDTPDELAGNLIGLSVNYSLVAGGFVAIGNIDADPLFFDPPAGDYRLQPGSPCIDAGKNDIDTDVSSPRIEPLPDTDYSDSPRFVDDPDTEDCPQPLAVCGIPPVVDMGGSEKQGMVCADISDCADTDDDSIRDDNCTWWACNFGSCDATVIVFADMGGQFGACPVDGATDNNDRNHALNCFANVNVDGDSGQYPCEAHILYPPTALNTDAGGPFGTCPPDGVCDGNDAFHALNAFSGATTCSCPLNGNVATKYPAPPVTRHVRLAFTSARQVIAPGEHLAVTVRLAAPVPDLRGYQLHVTGTGGLQGRLELIDIAIEDEHGPALAGLTPWAAFNVLGGQMVAGLDGQGVPVPREAYLATFVFRGSADARGVFAIELLADADDATQRSYLFATQPNVRIAMSAQPLHIEVRPAPH